MRNSAKPTQPGSAPSSRSYLINLVYFLEENRRGETKQNERKTLVNNHDSSKKSTHRHDGTTLRPALPQYTLSDAPKPLWERAARGVLPRLSTGPVTEWVPREPARAEGGRCTHEHEHTHWCL